MQPHLDSLLLLQLCGIREKIEYNDIPKPFKGTAIVLITACLMSIAFMGFSGMFRMKEKMSVQAIIIAAVIVGGVGLFMVFSSAFPEKSSK